MKNLERDSIERSHMVRGIVTTEGVLDRLDSDRHRSGIGICRHKSSMRRSDSIRRYAARRRGPARPFTSG
ncbi:MAG: hypothetical protein A3G25_03385 [Betaproteobacteria bacterium RIFCSPLOWO2_12_FULL_63_13]|nr:MAG: hypothetical protein A3G25_03385 [Betaproteobacteria bacterium RIFCSPLOWO2_12_FULL_63_13]